MLEILYIKNGSKETAHFDSAKVFLASQYLEVPPFQDHYPVEEARLDDVKLDLPEATIGGLFNFLTTQKNEP